MIWYFRLLLLYIASTCNGNLVNVLSSLEHTINKVNASVTTNSKESGVATIIFAGDISFDKPIRTDDGSACAYDGLLANVAKYFKEVDYNMVNLESPFVTKGMANQSFLPDKGIHNKAWPESIIGLTSAGIRSVTISNNHMGDFGGEAVILTNNILKENYIEVVGMTYGYEQPYTRQIPLIKKINGVKIGFLAYCGDASGECARFRPGIKAGPAILDYLTVKEDLSILKPQVDVVVVFLHWGSEYMSIPNEPQRELAILLKELGVDLIVASHPHVLQGHEWLNQTLVHYSLGNFVFHPHFTFMGALHGKKNKSAIHDHYIELSKRSRGPAGLTELLKVEFTKNGVKAGYYLPIRIHVDNVTACLYPKAKIEDDWRDICGPKDENCYVPKPGEPVY